MAVVESQKTRTNVSVVKTYSAPAIEETNAQPIDPAQPEKLSLTGRFARTFSSFKHRNYQLWFGGQLISVIGTWMQIIAEGWLVYQLSHSEFALGLVSFCSAIPVLLISPWGGVVTDVVPKRKLLVITQSVAMMLPLILSALVFTGLIQVWHIMAAATILGVVNAFDAPARQAFVVEMVGKEDLPNAIALNSMMFNGARVIGPAVGGLLLAWLGPALCYLVNGLSFIAVITGLLLMTLPKMDLPRRVEKPIAQFKEGVKYASSRKHIYGLLLLSAVFSTFGMAYSALMPAFVDQVLHRDAATYGIINTFIGVGAVTGALIVANLTNAGMRGKLLTTGNLVYPVLLILFGFNNIYALTLALALCMGLLFMFLGNNLNSLLQLNVEDHMRGRIMSLYTLTFFGFAPFGALSAGLIAEHLPLSWTIAIMASAMFVFSALIQWRIPEVRQMK